MEGGSESLFFGEIDDYGIGADSYNISNSELSQQCGCKCFYE